MREWGSGGRTPKQATRNHLLGRLVRSTPSLLAPLLTPGLRGIWKALPLSLNSTSLEGAGAAEPWSFAHRYFQTRSRQGKRPHPSGHMPCWLPSVSRQDPRASPLQRQQLCGLRSTWNGARRCWEPEHGRVGCLSALSLPHIREPSVPHPVTWTLPHR